MKYLALSTALIFSLTYGITWVFIHDPSFANHFVMAPESIPFVMGITVLRYWFTGIGVFVIGVAGVDEIFRIVDNAKQAEMPGLQR